MTTETEQQLGRNIAYCVEDLKRTTRAALAKAAGVSVQMIGQLIRGQVQGLNPLSLVHAARHLRVPVEDLVTRDLRELPIAEGSTAPLEIREPLMDYWTARQVSGRVKQVVREIITADLERRLTDDDLEFIERAVRLTSRNERTLAKPPPAD